MSSKQFFEGIHVMCLLCYSANNFLCSSISSSSASWRRLAEGMTTPPPAGEPSSQAVRSSPWRVRPFHQKSKKNEIKKFHLEN